MNNCPRCNGFIGLDWNMEPVCTCCGYSYPQPYDKCVMIEHEGTEGRHSQVGGYRNRSHHYKKAVKVES